MVKSPGHDSSLAEINSLLLCFAMSDKQEHFLNIVSLKYYWEHFMCLADITPRSPSLRPSPGILHMRKV